MKTSLIFLALLILVSVFPGAVKADSFVTISREGLVRTNVLGDSIDGELMKVQSTISNARELANATLSLVQEGEKSMLSISSPKGTEEKDVTKLTEDIVEIEQNEAPKTITIGKVDNSFGISQSGITALTAFPIHINAKEKTISVTTGSGERIIGILPDDAVETLIRANIINVVSKDGQMVLGEGENGELTYFIPAERNINVFNIHTIAVPVNTTVSATSGKVLKIDQPQWLKFLGFLFN